LKIYGVSEPDSEFFIRLTKTIQDQIDQISLNQKAENIYRNLPTISDFQYIKDHSEVIIALFRLPEFIKDFGLFLELLKTSILKIKFMQQ
jgi:hypothetical protein